IAGSAFKIFVGVFQYCQHCLMNIPPMHELRRNRFCLSRIVEYLDVLPANGDWIGVSYTSECRDTVRGISKIEAIIVAGFAVADIAAANIVRPLAFCGIGHRFPSASI